MVWNTVYTKEALKKHLANGNAVDENDRLATPFEYLPPAKCSHINRLGRILLEKVNRFQLNIGPVHLQQCGITGVL